LFIECFIAFILRIDLFGNVLLVTLPSVVLSRVWSSSGNKMGRCWI